MLELLGNVQSSLQPATRRKSLTKDLKRHAVPAKLFPTSNTSFLGFVLECFAWTPQRELLLLVLDKDKEFSVGLVGRHL